MKGVYQRPVIRAGEIKKNMGSNANDRSPNRNLRKHLEFLNYNTEVINPSPARNLRWKKKNQCFLVTRSYQKTHGDRALSVAAPRLWNAPPIGIRLSDPLNFFLRSPYKRSCLDKQIICNLIFGYDRFLYFFSFYYLWF